MEAFKLDRNLAHLAVLQRIELTTPFQKKLENYLEDIYFQKFFQNTCWI